MSPTHRRQPPSARRYSQGIQGITFRSLLKAWRSVRSMLPKATYRDAVDYLEFDVAPEVWIRKLLRDVAQGSYAPRPPLRYPLAKSNGFSRRLTYPHIPDLVLYRASVDFLYARARRREHAHVYFARASHAALQGGPAPAATGRASTGKDDLRLSSEGDYISAGQARFRAWLHYSQYRKHIVFKKLHPYIVSTDITNFFDSILFSHVSEALHAVPAPSRLVGLIFMLLEHFAYRGGLRESPRIGLPVDEFDCSRHLAHLVLLSHDDRMVHRIGEDAYTRWMDDHNFGARSRADGLRILAAFGDSVGRLHLTPNSAKSKITPIRNAKREFHLDLNDQLDALDLLAKDLPKSRRALRRGLRATWSVAKPLEGQGHWDKVLKRIYRLGGLAELGFLRRRAVADVMRYPSLTSRILDYTRCTGSAIAQLKIARAIWAHPEQVHPDVNLVVAESLLRLEPRDQDRPALRRLASQLAKGEIAMEGGHLVAATAPLLILRFGDRRSKPLLKRALGDRASVRAMVRDIRAASTVLAGYGRKDFSLVRRTASKLLQNELSGVVQLVERLRDCREVPREFRQRLSVKFDPVSGCEFVDMRTIVAARLLSLNHHPSVQQWLSSRIQQWRTKRLSTFDRQLLTRLLP